MRFASLPIVGAWSIELDRHQDERGYFARTWCIEEFASLGIAPIVQASVSYTRCAGTLRGMHFAWPPATEGKVVRCSVGRIHDVLLDLRPDSKTFLSHCAITLDAGAGNAAYIPPGVAHGFQSLQDDSEVFYMMTEAYRAPLSDGVRFDDPCFGIEWPLATTAVAERDRSYPDFDVDAHCTRFAAPR